MNPPDMFRDGKRLREHSMKDLLALSGKLLPEFDRRRNIRDMFTKKPSLKSAQSSTLAEVDETDGADLLQTGSYAAEGSAASAAPLISSQKRKSELVEDAPTSTLDATEKESGSNKKPGADTPPTRPFKRSKSGTIPVPASTPGKGQQSLKGFFKPKSPAPNTRAKTPARQGEELEALAKDVPEPVPGEGAPVQTQSSVSLSTLPHSCAESIGSAKSFA